MQYRVTAAAVTCAFLLLASRSPSYAQTASYAGIIDIGLNQMPSYCASYSNHNGSYTLPGDNMYPIMSGRRCFFRALAYPYSGLYPAPYPTSNAFLQAWDMCALNFGALAYLVSILDMAAIGDNFNTYRGNDQSGQSDCQNYPACTNFGGAGGYSSLHDINIGYQGHTFSPNTTYLWSDPFTVDVLGVRTGFSFMQACAQAGMVEDNPVWFAIMSRRGNINPPGVCAETAGYTVALNAGDNSANYYAGALCEVRTATVNFRRYPSQMINVPDAKCAMQEAGGGCVAELPPMFMASPTACAQQCLTERWCRGFDFCGGACHLKAYTAFDQRINSQAAPVIANATCDHYEEEYPMQSCDPTVFPASNMIAQLTVIVDNYIYLETTSLPQTMPFYLVSNVYSFTCPQYYAMWPEDVVQQNFTCSSPATFSSKPPLPTPLWTPTVTQFQDCKASCPAVSTPPEGTISITARMESVSLQHRVFVGGTVTLSCVSGFIVKGAANITCVGLNNWSPSSLGSCVNASALSAETPCLATNPCTGGECWTDGKTTYCQCAAQTTGTFPTCQPAASPCDISPCKNSGTCTPTGPTTFVCACPNLWGGTRCTIRKNGLFSPVAVDQCSQRDATLNYDGACYLFGFLAYQTPYWKASDICSSFGARLLLLENAAEVTNLQTQIATLLPKPISIWMGANANDVQNGAADELPHFEVFGNNLSPMPITTTNYATNTHRCLSSTTGNLLGAARWSDCRSGRGFICKQKQFQAAPPCPNNFICYNGHCLQIQVTPMTRYEAMAACMSQGLNLLADNLHQINAKYLRTLLNSLGVKQFWVGLTMTNATYLAWDGGASVTTNTLANPYGTSDFLPFNANEHRNQHQGTTAGTCALAFLAPIAYMYPAGIGLKWQNCQTLYPSICYT